MRIPVIRALLRIDPITVRRRPAVDTLDTEGIPNVPRVVVATVTRGTWREFTAREQALAAQRGTVMDAELGLELGADVRTGDWIDVANSTYEVIDMDHVRTYQRALLRTVK